MNLPNITEDTCPDPSAPLTCTDPRCSDPVFAAANPDICTPGGLLVLHPDFVTACAPQDMQFEAFLDTPAGEIPITAGVTFSSSNPSMLIIDAQSGQATALGQGIVTVMATWGEATAYAQVNILGTGNCCANVQVQTVVLLDNSESMGLKFGSGYASKLDAGKAAVEPFIQSVLSKDEDAITWFNAGQGTQVSLTNVVADLIAGLVAIPQSAQDTDIPGAFDYGKSLVPAAPGTLPVLLIVSDGQNVPALTTQARADLIEAAHLFKSSGGMILCVGVRAYGDGYTLLRSMANGGFFWNVYGDADSVAAAAASLECSLGYFCAGSNPPGGYGSGCAGYTCCDQPNGPQSPDPEPQCDTEAGPCPPPSDGPRLPDVVFDPSAGTVTPGFTVQLSVLSHPNAAIRYTVGIGSHPVAPAFGGAGYDYDGPYRPVHIEPSPSGQTVYVKAIARQTGYLDSHVAEASYASPSGPGQLSGLRWVMPCLGPLQGGGCTCHDPSDQTVQLTGNGAVLYDVVLRFRGVAELKPYVGGAQTPGTSFYTGGSPNPSFGSVNEYSLEVSNPPQTYYLNAGTFALTRIDYQVTVQMQGNALVTLKARSKDNAEAANNQNYVVGGDPPVGVNQPYNGQFLQMDVISVTPH